MRAGHIQLNSPIKFAFYVEITCAQLQYVQELQFAALAHQGYCHRGV